MIIDREAHRRNGREVAKREYELPVGKNAMKDAAEFSDSQHEQDCRAKKHLHNIDCYRIITLSEFFCPEAGKGGEHGCHKQEAFSVEPKSPELCSFEPTYVEYDKAQEAYAYTQYAGGRELVIGMYYVGAYGEEDGAHPSDDSSFCTHNARYAGIEGGIEKSGLEEPKQYHLREKLGIKAFDEFGVLSEAYEVGDAEPRGTKHKADARKGEFALYIVRSNPEERHSQLEIGVGASPHKETTYEEEKADGAE